jgi:peptidoglycan/LPS O-acetylase OafA/YrhL
MAGGLFYLYRKELAVVVNKLRWIVMGVCVLGTIAYLIVPMLRSVVVMPISVMILYTFYLILSIGTNGKFLNNQFTKFIAGISMEIYLCHMIIFRVVEKMHLNYLFGTVWIIYIITIVLVVIGAIIFSMCMKRLLQVCGEKMLKFK